MEMVVRFLFFLFLGSIQCVTDHKHAAVEGSVQCGLQAAKSRLSATLAVIGR